MKRKNMRKQSGGTITEFACALVFGLPLLVLIVFVTLETAHFYAIKSAMEVGARDAARGLVVNYNKTGTQSTTVNWLTMPNYIASSNQFEVAWDSSSPPQYVTVSCKYPSGGGNGLPPFPSGPLRYLTPKAQFDMGTFTVRGTFTFPIQ